MQFITGFDRHQMLFVTLDTQVSPDNAVRLIDAFVDKLDFSKTGFCTGCFKRGRPSALGAGCVAKVVSVWLP